MSRTVAEALLREIDEREHEAYIAACVTMVYAYRDGPMTRVELETALDELHQAFSGEVGRRLRKVTVSRDNALMIEPFVPPEHLTRQA